MTTMDKINQMWDTISENLNGETNITCNVAIGAVLQDHILTIPGDVKRGSTVEGPYIMGSIEGTTITIDPNLKWTDNIVKIGESLTLEFDNIHEMI